MSQHPRLRTWSLGQPYNKFWLSTQVFTYGVTVSMEAVGSSYRMAHRQSFWFYMYSVIHFFLIFSEVLTIHCILFFFHIQINSLVNINIQPLLSHQYIVSFNANEPGHLLARVHQAVMRDNHSQSSKEALQSFTPTYLKGCLQFLYLKICQQLSGKLPGLLSVPRKWNSTPTEEIRNLTSCLGFGRQPVHWPLGKTIGKHFKY